eukprot:15001801-Alexandrium_andersonii.AAC.1
MGNGHLPHFDGCRRAQRPSAQLSRWPDDRVSVGQRPVEQAEALRLSVRPFRTGRVHWIDGP